MSGKSITAMNRQQLPCAYENASKPFFVVYTIATLSDDDLNDVSNGQNNLALQTQNIENVQKVFVILLSCFQHNALPHQMQQETN